MTRPARAFGLLAASICGLGIGLQQAAAQTAPPRAPAQSTASAAAPVRFLVVASQESVLSASTAGRFAKVQANLGDTVRAGQLLAAFDCAEFQARRDAARAEAESARVQYEAKLKLQGLQSAAEVEVELAAANVNKAQSQIRIFDAQLGQCAFVAPFAGKVARVHAKVGQGVNPGAPVVELVGNGPLKARMNVPSQWLAWLKVGDRLQGTVDETASTCDLKVTRVAGRVDAVSQTVEIETELAGGAAQVLPGMSGQIRPPAGL